MGEIFPLYDWCNDGRSTYHGCPGSPKFRTPCRRRFFVLIFKVTYTEASSSKVVWLRWTVDLLSTGGPSHAETQLAPLPSSLPRRFPYNYNLRYQFRDAKKMLMREVMLPKVAKNLSRLSRSWSSTPTICTVFCFVVCLFVVFRAIDMRLTENAILRPCRTALWSTHLKYNSTLSMYFFFAFPTTFRTWGDSGEALSLFNTLTMDGQHLRHLSSKTELATSS